MSHSTSGAAATEVEVDAAVTGAATGGWIVVTIVATTVGTSAVTGAMTVGTGGTTAIDGMTVIAAATVGIGTATIGTATEGTGIGGIVTVIGPKAEIEVDTKKTVIVTKVAKMERTWGVSETGDGYLGLKRWSLALP